MTTQTEDPYYGAEMMARREKFNRIIRGIDMVLMNDVTEIDPDIYFGQWLGEDPMSPEPCEWFTNDATKSAWCCNTHMYDGTGDYPATEDHPDQCDFAEEDYPEIYQWFAVNSNDAEYLASHGQYVVYSDVLGTHFLAICHFGTAWDYVDSMVDAILGDKEEK